MHVEAIAWQAIQPNTGAAGTAVTNGDALVVKNNQGPKSPRFLAIWTKNQVAGFHQIVTPSQHDTTRGFRFVAPLGELHQVLPLGLPLTVQPQETLTITVAGSNVAADVEIGCGLLHYPNLPGVTQRAITFDTLLQRKRNLVNIQATLTGAAAGWTGSEAITAETDLLKANTDYAVLGFYSTVAAAAVAIRGPDTGHARIACPCDPDDVERSQEFFCVLARAYDMALIPVINSGNKATTQLDFLQDENNVTPLVTCFLAELS